MLSISIGYKCKMAVFIPGIHWDRNMHFVHVAVQILNDILRALYNLIT